jgi:Fe2+ or Zn2+ uptake regulation protein
MKKMSIGFHPIQSKINAKTQKIPINVRLIVDGQKSEMRLPSTYDLTANELCKWNSFQQRIDAKNCDINDYLNAINSRRKLLDIENLHTEQALSKKQILDRILGRRESIQVPTVYDYCKEFYRIGVIDNIKRKEGTKENYNNAIKQLCKYLEYNNLKRLTFQEFTELHAVGFKTYLETKFDTSIDKHPALIGKKVNTSVSSSTKVKNVKPIFKKAIKNG